MEQQKEITKPIPVEYTILKDETTTYKGLSKKEQERLKNKAVFFYAITICTGFFLIKNVWDYLISFILVSIILYKYIENINIKNTRVWQSDYAKAINRIFNFMLVGATLCLSRLTTAIYSIYILMFILWTVSLYFSFTVLKNKILEKNRVVYSAWLLFLGKIAFTIYSMYIVFIFN